MNYVAIVGGRDVKIKVEYLGGSRYRTTIDGEEHQVDALRIVDNLWSVLYRHSSFGVDVLPLSEDEFEVLIRGDCYKFTLMNEQRRAMIRAGGKGAAGKAMVSSPMPGKVVKVLVEPGQEVRAEQGVIVVEAMKMENELRSAVAGKIKEIFVREGEVVESGAKLLLVE
jgi:biotin carboxyl carrier protein